MSFIIREGDKEVILQALKESDEKVTDTNVKRMKLLLNDRDKDEKRNSITLDTRTDSGGGG